MNLLNGIWRHHLLSNKVGQNSRPLDNIHFKFSVNCVRFMYKYLTLCYIFFYFLIRRRLSFLKTFLVCNSLFFAYFLQFIGNCWLEDWTLGVHQIQCKYDSLIQSEAVWVDLWKGQDPLWEEYTLEAVEDTRTLLTLIPECCCHPTT